MGQMTKPDLDGTGLSHPARYSKPVLEAMHDALPPPLLGFSRVLDPFAGTGKAAEWSSPNRQVICLELEREWARLTNTETTWVAQTAFVVQGNALTLPFPDRIFDAIATSPTFGNRLADKHKAKDGSLRRSYTHDLGRDLSADNSGGMQWGDGYRRFHQQAWAESLRVLKLGGRFVLNIKDHIRGGNPQGVPQWHDETLQQMGLTPLGWTEIKAQHLRQGSNAERCPEWVVAYYL